MTYLEQPRVTFIRHCYCELHARSRSYMWSTFPELNAEAITHSLRIPYMTVTEVDKDGDGRLDQMNLQLRFLDQINVTSIYLVLFYELKLSVSTLLAINELITLFYVIGLCHTGN